MAMALPCVFLCEKPSQARDIAAVLGSLEQQTGYWLGTAGAVTWAFGHLLEMAAPEVYQADYQRWSFAQLPIIPEPWRWELRSSVAAQYRVISGLLKRTRRVVIATDADREGEAIAREILDREHWQGSIERLWLSALDEASIRKALAALLPGDQTAPLYAAAVARAKADWLVGMNLTHAYTLSAQAAGSRGVLSVGRVQTPTLNLVVTRDRVIETFKPVPFFTVVLTCAAEQGRFQVHWQVPDAAGDLQGRCVNRLLAEHVLARIQGQPARVLSVETQLQHELPPLPLDLSTLQLEASQHYGMGAQAVLETAQALYETHKAISYPRTDSRYLPVAQHRDAPLILQRLQTVPAYQTLIDHASATLTSRCWNDQKITAHHALIPTAQVVNPRDLPLEAAQVYDRIVRHYLAQFYPAHLYQQTHVVVSIGKDPGDSFQATGRVQVNAGWTILLRGHCLRADTDHTADAAEETAQALPVLTSGEPVRVTEASIVEKATQAPPRYTEGTLIMAMKNIGSQVTQSDYQKRLRETAGIGTEATRAGIIQTLLKRELLLTRGKVLLSTDKARALMDALPEPVKDPVMTAIWEQALDDIAHGKIDAAPFVTEQTRVVRQLVQDVVTRQAEAKAQTGFKPVASTQAAAIADPPYANLCPKCGQALQRRQGKKCFFWGCSGYPACKTLLDDADGVPKLPALQAQAPITDKVCPECGGSMRRKHARTGAHPGRAFLACTQYPACRYTEPCA